MDMRRLVLLSFGAKFIIAVFFLALVWAHYIFSKAIFQRTARLSVIEQEIKENPSVVNNRIESVDDTLNGLTPLMLAATWGDVDRVKVLLKSNATVNLTAANKTGDTALHMAVRNGNYGDFYNVLAIIKALLDAGADVNIKNNFGDTPLHTALDIQPRLVSSEIDEILGQFTEKNSKATSDYFREIFSNIAQPSEAPNRIETGRRKAVVDYLIKRGASINAQNNNGNTILHIAVDRDYWPFVQWFAYHYWDRINPDLKNKNDYTVVELAKARKYQTTIQPVEGAMDYVRAKKAGKNPDWRNYLKESVY